jgi:hypothetical protein
MATCKTGKVCFFQTALAVRYAKRINYNEKRCSKEMLIGSASRLGVQKSTGNEYSTHNGRPTIPI